MMKRFAEGASRIFLACGFTDFRKQIPGLVAMVTLNFKLDPYNSSYVFIFCNRRKDSIKVLRYDYNGRKNSAFCQITIQLEFLIAGPFKFLIRFYLAPFGKV